MNLEHNKKQLRKYFDKLNNPSQKQNDLFARAMKTTIIKDFCTIRKNLLIISETSNPKVKITLEEKIEQLSKQLQSFNMPLAKEYLSKLEEVKTEKEFKILAKFINTKILYGQKKSKKYINNFWNPKIIRTPMK